jgi:murein peptide amidase A
VGSVTSRVAAVAMVALAGAGMISLPDTVPSAAAAGSPPPTASPTPELSAKAKARARPKSETVRVGTSVQGREIVAYHRWTPGATKRVLAIGNMHGDEKAGLHVIDRLRKEKVPANVDLWLVPTVNPDGTAANTRVNARKVDLNRNFRYQWRYANRGDRHYSGPKLLSEPESRALVAFTKKIKPRSIIVFHQPLNGVDNSQAKSAKTLAPPLAKATGLPLKPFRCWSVCRGNYTKWVNARTSARAITVEFPEKVSQKQTDRAARAVLSVGSRY